MLAVIRDAMHLSDVFTTVAVLTVAYRCSTLPLVFVQARALQRVASGPNPAIAMQIRRLLAVEWQNKPDLASRRRSALLGMRGMLALLKGNRAAILLSPLVNVVGFSAYITTVRSSMRSEPGLWTEGGPWFAPDLMQADSTLVLPMAFIGLTYLSFDVGQQRPAVNAIDRFRQGMQTAALMSFPLAVFTPAGYFAYLVPSSAFSLVQAWSLRRWRERQASSIKEG